ncbi:hypothetical protein NHF50_03505 [Flavobacterium sp. NRK F10]|uniref:hypothetical protein n=1 Tax=Flavobacterium sp. NRK F10 TaxID=2954931 RepID=UPI00209024FC|nr:hypothetical protein [Flavobacterium sp. NRK F10]MCO6174103.1 hypothetical protein [Flavobacterium sp. NRK F10]
MKIIIQILAICLVLNISCNNNKERNNSKKIDSLIFSKIENKDSIESTQQFNINSFIPDVKVNNLELVNSNSIISNIGNLEKIR